jgi:prepilin-type N-terminal cleavage/methylation domain-containing protein
MTGRLRRDRSGFTLVELSIVLAILALTAVAGLPYLLEWKAATDLRGAASGIAESLLAARMRAVVDRRVYTATVDYATDLVTVTPPVGTAVRRAAADVYLDTSDPDCPALSSQDVAFLPNGTADASGFEAVYLRSRNAKVRTRYRVKVLGATGKVSLERWTGGEWVGAY